MKHYINRKRTWQLTSWLLLLVLVAAPVSAAPVAAAPIRGAGASPTNLTVNYAVEPLGIESHPMFGWDSQLSSQSAYQIQVAGSLNDLAVGACLWDSGKVVSSGDLQISYTGPALQSATRYYWQVRVWDSADLVSGWSDPSWWETGLLNLTDWGSAQWIGGRQPQDRDWTDMTETVNFRITNASSGITFLFHALPVGKTWGEAYSWQLNQGGAANTTLNAAAAAGDANIKVNSISGFASGNQITIDAGSATEQATIATVGTQAASTTLVAPAVIGDTNVKVASVTGMAVGGTLNIDTGTSLETATITAVGTAQGNATTVFFAATAGDTNIKVNSTSGFAVGAAMSVDTGTNLEIVTVTAVGTAGRATTLSAATAVGATNIKVASVTGLAVGDMLTIDNGANLEMVTITSVGTQGAGGTGVNVTPALAIAHANAASVRDQTQPGTGITFAPALALAHAINTTTRSLGTGVTFAPALTIAHASGAIAKTPGTGITLASPLANAHASGAAVALPAGVRLVESTRHYSGNTGVPGGTPAVQWGVNYYDSQSETNPTAVGTRTVGIATVQATSLGGITTGNLTTVDHQITIQVVGNTIITSLDGTIVDTRTVSGDQVRSDGSIGFASGGAGIVRNVTVSAPANPPSPGVSTGFFTDFAGGANPFDYGIPVYTAPTGNPATDGLPIGSGKNYMLPITNPAPLVRTDFVTEDKPIQTARLYVTGGGYPKVTINGQSVTTDGQPAAADEHNIPRITPDHTNFDKTVLYNTFDVTGFLAAGNHNVIGAEIGRGWYGVLVPDEWYWNMANYHGDPRMMARLVITYADATTQIVVTDPASWKTTDGPTTFDSVYTGEKYDARIAAALGAWQSPGYDDSSWTAATLMNPPGSCPQAACHGILPNTPPLPAGFVPAAIRAQENEPVIVNQVWHPVAVYETYPGSDIWVWDMGPGAPGSLGQIMTGWVHVHLTGITADKAGLTLRMRQHDWQTGSGTVASPYVVAEDNNFIDANMQTDYYTLSAVNAQDWEASFRYGGYRFIEVRGIRAVLGRAPDVNLDTDLLTAKVARSGFATASTFSSDNALMNRISSNTRWAEQNNMVHHPTDTPTREKDGWTGDAQAGLKSMLADFNLARFLTKWANDFPDSLISTGEWSEIVPAVKGGYGYQATPGWSSTFGPTPEWDAAYFVVPWESYLYYGNVQLFADLYDSQKTFMNYYATMFLAPDYNLSTALAVYAAAGSGGDSRVVNTQYYYYFADYMAKVGAMLGRTADAATYRALADDILRAMINKYWNETGTTGGAVPHTFSKAPLGNFESENIMAIEFGMVPGSDLAPTDPRYLATTQTQAQNIRSMVDAIAADLVARGYHIQAGMEGARFIFNLLCDYGYKDIAYAVVTQTTSPSWGYQISQGATSLWENWTGGSHDHHYQSWAETLFLEGFGGIAPTAPGYASIRIRPNVPDIAGTNVVPPPGVTTGLAQGKLNQINSSIQTVRGLVVSNWTRPADGTFHFSVSVPNNTPNEVWIPLFPNHAILAPANVTYLRHDDSIQPSGQNGWEVYTVGSGAVYTFDEGWTTTTTVAENSTSSVYGDPVTFTATVAATDASAGTPSGSVQFKLDGASTGAPVSLNGAGQATWSTTNLFGGTHSVSADYTPDSVNFVASSGQAIAHAITKAPLTITADNQSRQYSDLNPTLTGVISGIKNGDAIGASYSTTADSTSAPGSYPIVPAAVDSSPSTLGNYDVTLVKGTLNVTQEDAGVAYTGDFIIFTAPGGNTANVLLRATVSDSSLIASFNDTAPGDIRNATVTFKEGSTVLCGPAAAQLLGTETTIGTFSCTKSFGVGAHTISVYVGNYYIGMADGLVEVASPDGSFITGGGFRQAGTSAGTYAATAGSREQFTFNVKYNKNNTNIQGHANVIFVSGGKTYQIASNSLTSLGTALQTASGVVCAGPPSATCFGLANFRAKANLTDITNPLNPISVASNLTLQMTLTDKGEPGSNDSIGVTLYNGNTLLFSSEWNGAKTVEGNLLGGNLVVH